jgi:ABC-type oligopeptide transport system substrate-binding subunit
MAGFKNAHIYPFTPNLSAARRLAGRQARTAILYASNNSVCDQLTQIVKNNLAAIGIQVVAKKFSRNGLAKRLSNNGEPYDLAVGMYGWGADYPDPSNFLNTLLGPGSVEGFPTAADPSYLRQARAASKLTGPSRYPAYGKLDVDTNRNSAPWVPIGNQVSQDFLSARIGCQVYQPVYGMDLAALCIKH